MVKTSSAKRPKQAHGAAEDQHPRRPRVAEPTLQPRRSCKEVVLAAATGDGAAAGLAERPALRVEGQIDQYVIVEVHLAVGVVVAVGPAGAVVVEAGVGSDVIV